MDRPTHEHPNAHGSAMTAMPPEPDFSPQTSAGPPPPPAAWPEPMYAPGPAISAAPGRAAPQRESRAEGPSRRHRRDVGGHHGHLRRRCRRRVSGPGAALRTGSWCSRSSRVRRRPAPGVWKRAPAPPVKALSPDAGASRAARAGRWSQSVLRARHPRPPP